MTATKGSPSHTEQVLAAAGRRLRARQPAFDVVAGLHRLGRDAGYIPVADAMPSVFQALRDLGEFVSWSLDQPGAAGHVERLAVAIGEPPYKLLTRDQDTQEIDLDGAHIFACMLYVASHPESAQFWWAFAAGAGSGASAFCLHLLHHGRGETAEARHWREVLLNLIDLDDDPDVEKTFVTAVASFAAYTGSHRPPTPVTPVLKAEVRRLATRDDADDRLVCRPDAGLARRLQGCARTH
ncbi:hypothetical protein ACFY93_15095 [Streptomyces sp. NPDC008313]|uniref:hypothetical protein n=1 Tax=Streptomyces sp. NPDC008313 TaxID=3364826 RepID=UPI0036EFCAA7